MGYAKTFDRINDLRIAVIGDVMLDSYWYGSVQRISPEAPVPILDIEGTEDRLGGAANVALNTKNLGADTYLFSIIGEDSSGLKIASLLEQHDIDTEGLYVSEDYPTTTKTRVLSQNQQLVRIDNEKIDYIQESHAFIDHVLKGLQRLKPQIVILEDYNKGIFSEYVITKIIEHAKILGAFISVDPKNLNFLCFKDVDLFKPNWREVTSALNDSATDDFTEKHLLDIHHQLQNELNNRYTLITLSERGMFCASRTEHYIIPSQALQVRDVSGAGDTVIAVMSIMMYLTDDVELSTQVANVAGGIVCERPGVVPIDRSTLLDRLQ